ncbi:Ig-like domain-containing protein [Promicromonospora sp. NPDC052451]|uniref:Ig-like domain-containing protein n=1 Tax=Promicromonospora sp. NPDC052451 TaxID=3364407 RepID=UPI0037CAB382
MSLRRPAAAAAALLVTPLLLVAPTTARAEPLPAAYAGGTSGDILSLGLSVAGAIDVNAAVAHSATDVDSTAEPRSHAESANVSVGAVGLDVPVVSDEAQSGPAAGEDGYDAGLGSINVPGVLTVDALQATGATAWAGDYACVPDGTALATSETTVAGADVGLQLLGIGLSVLDLGTARTGGTTELQDGSVVSTATGSLAGLSLINGLVEVNVLDAPQITAQSDGTTGSVTANDYSVEVTIAGETVVLNAGASVPISLDLGVLAVDLTLSVGQLTDTSSGATGSGELSFLNLTGAITGPFGVEVASLDVGLLPLVATATAPTGGVECDGLVPPVITSPTGGDLVIDATPTITGTGVPGATVTVLDDGAPIGTTVVSEDGTWTFTPTEPLAEGENTLTATQELGDAASGPSDPVTVVVDTVPPEPPVITAPDDGGTTNDGTPTVEGTGEPGATVTVVVDGGEVGTAVVGDDGTWTFTPTEPLSDGDHEITATQTDAGGTTSDPSEPVTITVDTTAPAPPVITSPADGDLTDDGTPTIEGTGEPGATVTVVIDGEEAGTVVVGDDGTWTFTPDEPLTDGDHEITAIQTDLAGNTSEPSDPITVAVDTTAPAPPVITSPADGDRTDDNTPTIEGTGEPGATVTIIIDGEPVGETVVGDDGTWSFTPTTPLSESDHEITATQTDPAGNDSGPSDPVTVTVDALPPAPPAITSPTDRTLTNDSTPTIEGTGEPGATVAIIIDGEPVGETVVGDDGTWTFTPTTPLPDGDREITATQTDTDGTVSDPADPPIVITVDTTPPATPVVTSPTPGSTTTDNTPTISGTGEPGSTVTIIIDGKPAGTAVVDENGNWTFTPSTSLGRGEHTIAVQQTDPAGNTSDRSEPVAFEINSLAGGSDPDGSGTGGTGAGPSGPGSLAVTGSDTDLAVTTAIGLLCVLLGAGLIRVRQLRREA